MMILLLFYLCAFASASWAQEVGNLKRGVVKIEVATLDGKSRRGTGFVVHLAEDAVHIVTASHVVEDARDVQVEFFTRRNRPVPAEIIGMEEPDLKGVAVLLVEGDVPPGLVRLELNAHIPVYAGDAVVMIGFPSGGASWSVSKGEAVGRHRKHIVFSGPVEEGSSGGPLIKEGQVIGVVSETTKTFSYGTPALVAGYVLEGWGVPDAQREARAHMLAAAAETVRRRSVMTDPEDERYHWPDLMKAKGRDDLIKLSVLLAVESMRRLPSPEAQQALRAGLGLLNRPIARFAAADTVAFGPDNRVLAVADSGAARTLDVRTAKETARFNYGADARVAAYSPDLRFLGTGTESGIAQVWDVANGGEAASMKHDRAVRSVAFSPDGRSLLTISGALTKGALTRVHLWDITTGRERWRLSEKKQWRAIAIDPKGTYVAARTGDSSAPGQVWVGELASGNELWRMTFERPVEGIVFSSDGKHLAASSWTASYIWSITDGQELVRILEGSSGPAPLAFSPDGGYLATAKYRRASAWDLSRGVQHPRMLPGDDAIKILHEGDVTAVVFSPDGKYLATGSRDATARLWGLPAGKELARMQHQDPHKRHQAPVTDLAFSPDGQYLVSRTRDGTAKLWRLWSEDLIAEACTRLDRNLTPHEWRTYMGDEPYRRICKSLQ